MAALAPMAALPFDPGTAVLGLRAAVPVWSLGSASFGFARLSDVNHASEVIRNHWLRDTGILGDLSNYMSDYRAAEATSPVVLDAAGVRRERQRNRLAARYRRRESACLRGDRAGPTEAELYAQFAKQWSAYQIVADQVIALARAGDTSRAVALYNTQSRRAFDLSSDI